MNKHIELVKKWLGKWNSVGDMYLTDVYRVRSLADIKEIEQLKAELVTAKAELDELGEQCRKVTFFKLQPLKEKGE